MGGGGMDYSDAAMLMRLDPFVWRQSITLADRLRQRHRGHLCLTAAVPITVTHFDRPSGIRYISESGLS
jgi:hypothetical protein